VEEPEDAEEIAEVVVDVEDVVVVVDRIVLPVRVAVVADSSMPSRLRTSLP
jgi:hypothetical protein